MDTKDIYRGWRTETQAISRQSGLFCGFSVNKINILVISGRRGNRLKNEPDSDAPLSPVWLSLVSLNNMHAGIQWEMGLKKATFSFKADLKIFLHYYIVMFWANTNDSNISACKILASFEENYHFPEKTLQPCSSMYEMHSSHKHIAWTSKREISNMQWLQHIYQFQHAFWAENWILLCFASRHSCRLQERASSLGMVVVQKPSRQTK